jgi:hypothetical protein
MAYSERVEPAEAAVDATAVHKALVDILRSGPFRTSKQCQDMLRYVVEHSLRGEQESLRERVIGIEVFGRSSDYDTSEDPVVRVRAADIRKRLAQYYQSTDHESARVQIEIPSGSYRANFRTLAHEDPAPPTKDPVPLQTLPPVFAPALVAPPNQEMPPPPPRLRRYIPWVFAALVVLAIPIVWVLRASEFHRPTPLEMFWSPVIENPKPVLIYAGANAVYRLSDDFLDRYRKEHHLPNMGPEFFPAFTTGEKIDAGDLIAVTTTTADAKACALLVALMTRYDRSFDLRYGSDISVGDLHDSPTILVGGFNNSWTLSFTRPLRFQFRDGTRVEDSSGKLPGWTIRMSADGQATDDYAVITRLINLQTGHVLVTVSGIGSTGTEAAAEFLTNPRKMADLPQSAPPGWQKKNMQIVLHTRVMDNTVDGSNIVATEFW